MTSMEQAKREAHRVSGVSNVAYDLLTILQNKLTAVAAMEEYKTDAQEQGDKDALELLSQLERRESEDIAQLKRIVAARLT